MIWGNVMKCRDDGSWVDKDFEKLKKKCEGYHTDYPSSSSSCPSCFSSSSRITKLNID